MEGISDEVLEVARNLFDGGDIDYNIDRYGKATVNTEELPDLDNYEYTYGTTRAEILQQAIDLIVKILPNVTFYNDYNDTGIYLELSDNHTFWDINEPEGFDGEFDYDLYNFFVEQAFDEFENQTGVELYQCGRSGRHICVEVNFDNILNYDNLCKTQAELEQQVIGEAESNCFGQALEEAKELAPDEKVAKCLSCGMKIKYKNRDVQHDAMGDYLECPNCHSTFDVDYDNIASIINEGLSQKAKEELIQNAVIPEIVDILIDGSRHGKSLDDKKVDYVTSDRVLSANEFDKIVTTAKELISSNKQLTRSELYLKVASVLNSSKKTEAKSDAEIVNETSKYLADNGVYAEVDIVDGDIILNIPWGDWKHDHQRADYLMKQKGYVLEREEVTEEDGSDTYSAMRYYVPIGKEIKVEATDSADDIYNKLPNTLKNYLKNTDNVPTKEIDGTLWFNVTAEEKEQLENFVQAVDTIPESAWRNWDEKTKLDISSYANNANRICKNCVLVKEGKALKIEAEDYSVFKPAGKVLSGNKGLSEKEIDEIRRSLPNLFKDMTDEQKQIWKELSLRGMVMSCLVYDEDIHTSTVMNAVSKYYKQPYVNEYYDTLGKDVTEEIIKQQTEYFNKGKVIKDVGTDSDGLSYNSFVEPKDESKKVTEDVTTEQLPSSMLKDKIIKIAKSNGLTVDNTGREWEIKDGDNVVLYITPRRVRHNQIDRLKLYTTEYKSDVANKFIDELKANNLLEQKGITLGESKKTEAEDMTQVKNAIETAVEKSASTDLEKDQVKGSIDVLKTDEESAIEGYEDFRDETEKVADKELADAVNDQMEEIVDDEKEHIEKLDTIKSALGESKSIELCTDGSCLAKSDDGKVFKIKYEDEVDEPYYTIECEDKDGNIIEVYGFDTVYNSADEAEKAFKSMLNDKDTYNKLLKSLLGESKEIKTELKKGQTISVIYTDKDGNEKTTHFECDKNYDIDGEQIRVAIKSTDNDIDEIIKLEESKEVKTETNDRFKTNVALHNIGIDDASKLIQDLDIALEDNDETKIKNIVKKLKNSLSADDYKSFIKTYYPEYKNVLEKLEDRSLKTEDNTSSEFNLYIKPEELSDVNISSLLFDSDTTIATYKEGDYELSLMVRGSVKIWDNETGYCYKNYQSFPVDLQSLIRSGALKSGDDTNKYTVDMSNWFEWFLDVADSGDVVDNVWNDVADIEGMLNKATPEENETELEIIMKDLFDDIVGQLNESKEVKTETVKIMAYGKLYYEYSNDEWNSKSEDEKDATIIDVADQATEEEGHIVYEDEVEVITENRKVTEAKDDLDGIKNLIVYEKTQAIFEELYHNEHLDCEYNGSNGVVKITSVDEQTFNIIDKVMVDNLHYSKLSNYVYELNEGPIYRDIKGGFDFKGYSYKVDVKFSLNEKDTVVGTVGISKIDVKKENKNLTEDITSKDVDEIFSKYAETPVTVKNLKQKWASASDEMHGVIAGGWSAIITGNNFKIKVVNSLKLSGYKISGENIEEAEKAARKIYINATDIGYNTGLYESKEVKMEVKNMNDIIDRLYSGDKVYFKDTTGYFADTNQYYVCEKSLDYPKDPNDYDEGYTSGWNIGDDTAYDKEQERKYQRAKKASEDGDVWEFNEVDENGEYVGVVATICYGKDELQYVLDEANLTPVNQVKKFTEKMGKDADKKYSNLYKYKGKAFAYDNENAIVEYVYVDPEDNSWIVLDEIGLSNDNWDNKEARDEYLDEYIAQLDDEANRLADDFIANEYLGESLASRYVKTENKSIKTEASEGTATLDAHTDLLPIINMYQYDLYNMCDDLVPPPNSDMSKDVDEAMLDIAEPIIETEIKGVLPSAKITFKEYEHPKYYKLFSNLNDVLYFDITYNVAEYEALKEKAIKDPEFEQYLKDHYKSYDGFMSFFADNLTAFNQQEEWKQFVSVLSYYLPNDDEQNYNTLLSDTYDKLLEMGYEPVDSIVDGLVDNITDRANDGEMTLNKDTVTQYIKELYGDVDQYDYILDGVLNGLSLSESKKTEAKSKKQEEYEVWQRYFEDGRITTEYVQSFDDYERAQKFADGLNQDPDCEAWVKDLKESKKVTEDFWHSEKTYYYKDIAIELSVSDRGYKQYNILNGQEPFLIEPFQTLRDAKKYIDDNNLVSYKKKQEAEDVATATKQAVEYWVGDPCYVLPDDIYDDIWGKKYDYKDGTIDCENGLSFQVHGTAWGDGCYDGSDGFGYCVDSGTLAVIPMALAKKESGIKDGTVHKSATATLDYQDGVFHIEFDKEVIDIDTDPPNDDYYDEDNVEESKKVEDKELLVENDEIPVVNPDEQDYFNNKGYIISLYPRSRSIFSII